VINGTLFEEEKKIGEASTPAEIVNSGSLGYSFSCIKKLKNSKTVFNKYFI